MSLAPCLQALQELLGARCVTSQAVREHHAQGESWHPPQPPDAVCLVESTEETAAVARVCHQYRIPMIGFGAGTSLEGHIAAPEGGVCIDFSRMNRVLSVNPEDLDCRVQAGVTRSTLNAELRTLGLFFPVDPGADATLGGMTATRASGTTTVRYGGMRQNVLGLTAVLADGRIIHTGGRARKSASGYDLTALLTGSEGTLALITEVQLRLYGVPEATSAARVGFSDMEAAVATVVETLQLGIPIARIEFLDTLTVQAVNRHSHLGLAEQPTLFLEFHGSMAGVREQAEAVGELARAHGGGGFQWSEYAEDRTALWAARHNALYAILALRPGSRAWTTDVCVPISQLVECLRETRQDLDNSSLIAPIVGHVGDGNFHVVFVLNPDNENELQEAERLNARLVERALALGGSCSGEHGIGLGKRGYLRREHGEAVDVMRSLKQAMDPFNLLNPGKLLPAD